jgi:hypothetical protein
MNKRTIITGGGILVVLGAGVLLVVVLLSIRRTQPIVLRLNDRVEDLEGAVWPKTPGGVQHFFTIPNCRVTIEIPGRSPISLPAKTAMLSERNGRIADLMLSPVMELMTYQQALTRIAHRLVFGCPDYQTTPILVKWARSNPSVRNPG